MKFEYKSIAIGLAAFICVLVVTQQITVQFSIGIGSEEPKCDSTGASALLENHIPVKITSPDGTYSGTIKVPQYDAERVDWDVEAELKNQNRTFKIQASLGPDGVYAYWDTISAGKHYRIIIYEDGSVEQLLNLEVQASLKALV